MKKTRETISEAYRLGRRMVPAYVEYVRCCEGLIQEWRDDENRQKPSRQGLEELEHASVGLAGLAREGRPLVEALREGLAEVSEEPVWVMDIAAASKLEGLARLCAREGRREVYRRDLDLRRQGDRDEIVSGWWIEGCSGYEDGLARFDGKTLPVELEIEEARLRKGLSMVRVVGGAEEWASGGTAAAGGAGPCGEFTPAVRALKHGPRRLLEVLAENVGRAVSFETIAEAACSRPDVGNQAIHSLRNRLKAELPIEFCWINDLIEATGGGYRLMSRGKAE